MEFIRQVGSQAEVNDGGKIRRLPFSGEGVAPQPGAKVSPKLDGCCCPTSVPLNLVKELTLNRQNPRRVSVNNKQKGKFWRCLPSLWLDFSVNGGFGYGNNNFKELAEEDFKFIISPSYMFRLPIPKFWLEWSLKTDSMRVVEVKPTDTIFFWVENGGFYDNPYLEGEPFTTKIIRYQTFSEYLTSIDTQEVYFFRRFKDIDLLSLKDKLRTPLTGSKVKLKALEARRDLRPLEAFAADARFGYRGYNREVDHPDSYYKQAFKKLNPFGQLWYSKDVVPPLIDLADTQKLLTSSDFMRWYKTPESFKYERLY